MLDFAYNPINFHSLTTCGADGSVRVWDLRKTDKCALQLQQGHSYNGSCAIAEGGGHMVTKIRYNPSFDQLMLTGGTSTFVSLFRAPSVSSTPTSSGNLINDLNNTSFNMSMLGSVRADSVNESKQSM